MFKKRTPEDNKNASTLGNIPPKPTAAVTPPAPTSAAPTPKMATPPKAPTTPFPPSATTPRSTQGHSSHHHESTAHRNPSRTLVVGSGISVQGTILDAECLIVEGIVEADRLHAQELIVAQGGTFRGTIDVENAELSGTIDGNLTARNCLTVQSTGRLIGKAECRRLQVEDGGQITGELNVITNPVANTSEHPRAAE